MDLDLSAPHSMGTTIIGVTYNGGVILGADSRTSTDDILQSSNLNNLSFSDLKASTRNFRPNSVLGEGGFGSVFKGWIDETTMTPSKPGTGMAIAVKRLNQDSLQGHKEWLVSE